MSSTRPECTSETPSVNRHAEPDADQQDAADPGTVEQSGADQAVQRYRPKAVPAQDWEPVAEFTRAVALEIHSGHQSRAIESMRTLSQFVVWAHREGLPLEREVVFTPDVVERYIAVGAAHLSEASRATRRSDLRRFSVAVTRKAPWAPKPARLRSDYGITPYTAQEVTRLLEVAGHQRTRVQKRRLSALLALGLGAGVYPREAWRVSTEHLIERHGFLCLNIPGDDARIVPITHPHDQTLAAIAREDPGSTILGFVAKSWDRSRLGSLLERAEIPDDCPPVKVHRLRATWLQEHLTHRAHLNGLARVAGVTSWKTFGHLMSFMPDIDEQTLFPELVRR